MAEQLIKVESVLMPLMLVTACGVPFALEANDVASAIGPFAAVSDMVIAGAIATGSS